MRSALLLIACILACIVLALPRPETFSGKAETIFVSVASYRDKGCINTIKDIYAKATHPERVFVGICEQNTNDAQEACVPGAFKWFKNVRRVSIPHTEALGPTYARYLCSTLFRGETFFCQIDSHTKFVQGWDDIAKEQLALCDSKRAVLSGYPHDSKAHDLGERSVPVLCDSKWNDEGIPQFTASVISAEDAAKNPVPSSIPFTSGGFIFGPGSILADVAYDPGLSNLFQGEEFLFSARLWTSGYDIFSAKKNIVFHHYTRKGEARWHDDNKAWHETQKTTTQRVRRILGLEQPAIKPGEDRYALGTARTIEAYWAFSGLDPASKTSSSKAKFC